MRVSPARLSADTGGLVMDSGPWLCDSVGKLVRGSLGVALDDVTGYVVAACAPAGKWPVSSSIRLDFLADPPLDGSPMTATGELMSLDDRGGTTRGQIVDAAGEIIALVTQRSHLVSVAARPVDALMPFVLPADECAASEAMGFGVPVDGTVEMRPTGLAANPMGNIHGGILIYGSELAALSVLDSRRAPRVTSIDITFVRPCAVRGVVTFGAEIVHRGRVLSVLRVADAANSMGEHCAVATVITRSGSYGQN